MSTAKTEAIANRAAFPQHGTPPRLRRRLRPGPVLLLLPAVLLILAVLIYPIAYGLYLSLFDYVMTLSPELTFVALANYQKLFADASFVNSIAVTARFTAITVALEFAIGLGIALLLTLDLPARPFFRAAVLLPLMVPPLVSGLLWRLMYDHELGVLSFFVRALGGEPPVFLGDPDIALLAVSLTEVWRATPFMVLVLLAALQAVPSDLHEAAQIDGAGALARFRDVTVPLILPVVLIALLFRTVDVLRTFDLIYLLTQGGPGATTEVLSMFIYRYGFQSFDMGLTSAASMLLFALTLIVCAVYLRMIVRRQAADR
ncbi:MAG: sugar ABC transporter permease [Chloroflexia bacterium]|nr:sugar ABC transporter permease [Chloroflexia bacterium]